jgi:flagellar basal-body rod protein FlgB
MDLSKNPLLHLLGQKMAWLSQRQEVLSANVANSSTPGFRPSDLAPMDFKGMVRALGRLEAVKTQGSHIGVSLRAEGEFAVVREREGEAAPDGNAVDLEEQMVKMAETQMDYQLITNLYRKHVGMIKAALGRV